MLLVSLEPRPKPSAGVLPVGKRYASSWAGLEVDLVWMDPNDEPDGEAADIPASSSLS